MKFSFKFANLKTKPKILLGICSPLVLLAALGGVAIFGINSIVTTNKWVDHTHVVLGKAAAIVSSAVDMETGMRGYLLAGKDAFLDPYKGGEAATYDGIAELQETVNDNPAQVARLGEVEKVLRAWQKDVTEPTIQLRRDIGDAQTMNDMARLVGEARGKVYFDKVRKQIKTFSERETKLLGRSHPQGAGRGATDSGQCGGYGDRHARLPTRRRGRVPRSLQGRQGWLFPGSSGAAGYRQ
jgi:methyl-accepting chemotaxis protein